MTTRFNFMIKRCSSGDCVMFVAHWAWITHNQLSVAKPKCCTPNSKIWAPTSVPFSEIWKILLLGWTPPRSNSTSWITTMRWVAVLYRRCCRGKDTAIHWHKQQLYFFCRGTTSIWWSRSVVQCPSIRVARRMGKWTLPSFTGNTAVKTVDCSLKVNILNPGPVWKVSQENKQCPPPLFTTRVDWLVLSPPFVEAVKVLMCFVH